VFVPYDLPPRPQLVVVDVKEVVVGVRDLEAAERLWQRLLEPAPLSGLNTWRVGGGPAIRLVPAPRDGVQALVIRLASVERAKAFLRDNRLLGAEAEGQVTIDPSKVGGLVLRLVGP
jgi:hypothetical protein